MEWIWPMETMDLWDIKNENETIYIGSRNLEPADQDPSVR